MLTIESTLTNVINWHKPIDTMLSKQTSVVLLLCLELLKKGYSSNEDLEKVFAAGLNKMAIQDFPPKSEILHLLG
jgi:hypothetical protein